MTKQLEAAEAALARERTRVQALEAELRSLHSKLVAEDLQANAAAAEVPRCAVTRSSFTVLWLSEMPRWM